MTKLSITALVIFFTCLLNTSFAQKGKSESANGNTYVSPNAKITKIYTKEELEKLGKLELAQIYMERIAVITELAPYIALHTQPGATLEQMGIPKTEQNIDHLEKEVKNKDAYLKSVKETLNDIVPYADKQNIIWAILFYDEMIQKIEAQSTNH